MNLLIPSVPRYAWGRALVTKELLLLVASLCLLSWLAHALAEGSAGLNDRYLGDLAGGNGGRAAQAIWLASHVGSVLWALGLGGGVSMVLARVALPAGAALCAWLALWSALAAMIYPHEHGGVLSAMGLPSPTHWALWMAGAAAVLLPLMARLTRRWWLPAQQITSVWGYPGFVLFTGLCSLWLLDYAARSRPKWRYLGVEHLDTLFVAFAALGLVTRFAPSGFAWLARTWARWDRARHGSASRWALGLNAVPWLLGGLWVVAVVRIMGRHDPAKSSELIHIAGYLLGGWVLYRWAGDARHALRAGLGVVLVATLTSLALGGTHDFGQLMVLTWVQHCCVVLWWLCCWYRLAWRAAGPLVQEGLVWSHSSCWGSTCCALQASTSCAPGARSCPSTSSGVWRR